MSWRKSSSYLTKTGAGLSVAELQAGMESLGITMSEADIEILIEILIEIDRIRPASGDGQLGHGEIARRLECTGPC